MAARQAPLGAAWLLETLGVAPDCAFAACFVLLLASPHDHDFPAFSLPCDARAATGGEASGSEQELELEAEHHASPALSTTAAAVSQLSAPEDPGSRPGAAGGPGRGTPSAQRESDVPEPCSPENNSAVRRRVRPVEDECPSDKGTRQRHRARGRRQENDAGLAGDEATARYMYYVGNTRT